MIIVTKQDAIDKLDYMTLAQILKLIDSGIISNEDVADYYGNEWWADDHDE